MTLNLNDQHRLATAQEDFLDRVTAASFSAAVWAYSQPPLSNSTQQAQRVALYSALFKDAEYATPIFAWLCASANVVNVVADLTDAFLLNHVQSLFDSVAQQIMPTPVSGV